MKRKVSQCAPVLPCDTVTYNSRLIAGIMNVGVCIIII